VGDLAAAVVRGEVSRGALVQGDAAMSASSLGFAFDDPVADVDVLTVDGEAAVGQATSVPTPADGFPRRSPVWAMSRYIIAS
jgi:hypothetical protein